MRKNKITQIREKIHCVVREIAYNMPIETVTIEADITPYAIIFVDIKANDASGYTKVEILNVEIYKDTYRRECTLPNIAEEAARELDKAAEFYNRDAHYHYVYREENKLNL